MHTENSPARADGSRVAQESSMFVAGDFGMSALRCAVDPKATIDDLSLDFDALFFSALSAIESMTEVAGSSDAPREIREPWFAMLYTLRQSMVVWKHLSAKVSAGAAA